MCPFFQLFYSTIKKKKILWPWSSSDEKPVLSQPPPVHSTAKRVPAADQNPPTTLCFRKLRKVGHKQYFSLAFSSLHFTFYFFTFCFCFCFDCQIQPLPLLIVKYNLCLLLWAPLGILLLVLMSVERSPEVLIYISTFIYLSTNFNMSSAIKKHHHWLNSESWRAQIEKKVEVPVSHWPKLEGVIDN